MGVIPDDILRVNHLDALYDTLGRNDEEETCISQWRDVGSQLEFSTQELDDVHKRDVLNFRNIRRSRCMRVGDKMRTYWDSQWHISESGKCMIEMLRQWLQWYPKDCRGSTSFPKYQSLIKALINAGFGNVVSNLWSYQDIVAAAKEYE